MPLAGCGGSDDPATTQGAVAPVPTITAPTVSTAPGGSTTVEADQGKASAGGQAGGGSKQRSGSAQTGDDSAAAIASGGKSGGGKPSTLRRLAGIHRHRLWRRRCGRASR